MADSNTLQKLEDKNNALDERWDDFVKSLETPDQDVSQEEWNAALSILSRSSDDEESDT